MKINKKYYKSADPFFKKTDERPGGCGSTTNRKKAKTKLAMTVRTARLKGSFNTGPSLPKKSGQARA